MAEVIKQLEKTLGIKSVNINKLLKSDNSWYNSEYMPPEKYRSFKISKQGVVSDNEVVQEPVENSGEPVVNEFKKVINNGKMGEQVPISTLAPSINYLMSVSKNSKNTRAKVEARQALSYLKDNTDGTVVTKTVYERVEKAVEYLKGYFGD